MGKKRFNQYNVKPKPRFDKTKDKFIRKQKEKEKQEDKKRCHARKLIRSNIMTCLDQAIKREKGKRIEILSQRLHTDELMRMSQKGRPVLFRLITIGEYNTAIILIKKHPKLAFQKCDMYKSLFVWVCRQTVDDPDLMGVALALVDAGVDPNEKTSNGYTYLGLTCILKLPQVALRLLSTDKADPSIIMEPDTHKFTSLWLVLSYDLFDVAEAIIETGKSNSGAIVYPASGLIICDTSGKTVLELACKKIQSDLALRIIRLGKVDINYRGV